MVFCAVVAVVMLESRVARCVHCEEEAAWLNTHYPNTQDYSVKIIACFQVEVMAPSRYNLLAGCDNSPVIILMFIWMILNKTIQISATEWFGYLQWNSCWNCGNQVKLVIDGNKRQVYLIINYIMFVILICNCTWYKWCAHTFYMTFHNLYENQQHRNNIVLTYITWTWLFGQCTNRLQTGRLVFS